MMAHHGLFYYMGLFVLYTSLAIGAIYGIYWYLRKGNMGKLTGFGKKGGPQPLEVESMMTLEARKNLYVIKAGSERFLIATSMDGTQFLSRLEEPGAGESVGVASVIPQASVVQGEPVTLPFEIPGADKMTHPAASKPGALTPAEPDAGFSGRLLHSLRWLASSRISMGKGQTHH